MEKFQDLKYISNSKNKKHTLDVYSPLENGVFPVLIFIHGGSWHTGCKETYQDFGRNFAAKGIVTVIINYRLGNEANFEDMASDCASAIRWVYDNIHAYKGQTSNIFLSGHSAGGHLSALVTLNTKFILEKGLHRVIRGCILIDAFGLNMDYVMHNNTSFYVKELQNVFTTSPAKWKEAAPVHFIKGNSVPFFLFTGGKTYPYLTMDNEVFKMNLEENKVPYVYKVIPFRNHVEMITTMQNPSDILYKDILCFVKENSINEFA
jgi:acetyl esterase/lipase